MKKILKKIIPDRLKFFVIDFINGRYCYFFWLLPIKSNRIVICNFYGQGFGDNPKYIVEEIIKRGLDFDIVWLVKKDLMGKVRFPTKVRVVEYKSFRSLYELATARLWLDNCRKVFYPPKRKSQFYIQTWHGGLGVKSVEKDAESKLSKIYVWNAKKDAKITDLMISDGSYITNLFSRSFWYDGDIMECGFPRNDILLQNSEEMKKQIKERLNLKLTDKILLYAPTFRNIPRVEDYLFDSEKVRDSLHRKFGGNWVILFRLHPNISSVTGDLIKFPSDLIDVSKYEDLQELLLVSDAFMTDFSGCLSDFFLLKRPIFLYCTNYSDYFKERGFSTDIKSLGFPMAESNEELIKHIEEFNMEDCMKAIEANYRRLGLVFNQHSARDIVDLISDKMNLEG